MDNLNANQVNTTSRFRGEILRQIYRVWLFRKLAPIVFAEIILLTLAISELANAIFVRRVAENALNVFSQNPSGIFLFFAAAFTHTSFLTKILILAFFAVIAFLVRHLTQGILRFILVRENYFRKI